MLTSEDDRIRFEHPLLASVIYGSASAERRRNCTRALALLVPDRHTGAMRALVALNPTRLCILRRLTRHAKSGRHKVRLVVEPIVNRDTERPVPNVGAPLLRPVHFAQIFRVRGWWCA